MSRVKGSKNKVKRQAIQKPQAQESLLASPWTDYTRYLPSFYIINPTPEKIILPYERRQQIQLGRDLFAKMPIVSAAILNKNHIAVGSAWDAYFGGTIRNDADKAWVQAATEWLKNDYYPNLNWMGQNCSFNDTLVLTGKDIDVDGGSLMVYRNTKSGLPRIQLVPTDRIGNRDNADVVSGGQYDGYKIYDGIIFNTDNMPIALYLLGDTKEQDQQISLFNCQYLYEPVWDGAVHGVSRIANAVTNLMDIRDINDLLKITVKNFSAKGIIHKNSRGAAPKGKRMFSIATPAQPTGTAVKGEMQNKIFFESVNKGGTEYISSTDGSDIMPFNFDRPSPNTEAFIFRISSEAIASMGWFIELVTPSKLNGTSVRLIQDQARKLVTWRQATLERRAKAIVQYGLATAMQQGLVPMTDNKTWMRWNFNKPAELTVDSGYDNAAQIESQMIGNSSKAETCAKRGKDWRDVDKQIDVEIDALFARAKALADKWGISEAEAREWLSKRDIDVMTPQPPQESQVESDTKESGATPNPANN